MNFTGVPLDVSKRMKDFLLWGSLRFVVVSPLLIATAVEKLGEITVTVSRLFKSSYGKILVVYDSLPYGQTSVPVSNTPRFDLVNSLSQICNNPIEKLKGKHALIIGDTGSGKSTLTQYLAFEIGGQVKVYDSDATPDEWRGLEVYGRGGNVAEIEIEMQQDLIDLEDAISLRGLKGDSAVAGQERVLIAEEYPFLKDEIEIAPTWLMKHARRGRKPRKFVIALAQDDNVKTLGIDGEGSVRKCFRYFRLGKVAQEHAKRLKDEALLKWLREGEWRCLIDDEPCQLPDLKSYLRQTQRLLPQTVSQTVKTLETTVETESQPLSPPPEKVSLEAEILLWKAIERLLAKGTSESSIVTEFLGYSGRKYSDGKTYLEDLRRKYGD